MNNPSLIRFSKIKELTGYSRSTIDRLEKVGQFPSRVKMSRNSVGWYIDEVTEWLSTRPRGFLSISKKTDKKQMSTILDSGKVRI